MSPMFMQDEKDDVVDMDELSKQKLEEDSDIDDDTDDDTDDDLIDEDEDKDE